MLEKFYHHRVMIYISLLLILFISFPHCNTIDDSISSRFIIKGFSDSKVSEGDMIGLVIFSKHTEATRCESNAEMRPLVKRPDLTRTPSYGLHEYREYRTFGHQKYDGSDEVTFRYPLPDSVSDSIFDFYERGVFIGFYVEKGNNQLLDKNDLIFIDEDRASSPNEIEGTLGYEMITACFDYIGLGGLSSNTETDLSQYTVGRLDLGVNYFFAATPIFLWNSPLADILSLGPSGTPEGNRAYVENTLCSESPPFTQGTTRDVVVSYSNRSMTDIPIPHAFERHVIGRLDKSLYDVTQTRTQVRERIAFNGWNQVALGQSLTDGASFISTRISINPSHPAYLFGGEPFSSGSNRDCEGWSTTSSSLSAAGRTVHTLSSITVGTAPCFTSRDWLCVTYE